MTVDKGLPGQGTMTCADSAPGTYTSRTDADRAAADLTCGR